MVQEGYCNIVSPDYTGILKDESYTRVYSKSDTFKELLEISGIKPEIPEDQLQAFYRVCVDGLPNHGGSSIDYMKKIAEMTGVKPVFDPDDINNLYKKWILSELMGYITEAIKVTGIELQMDQETLDYIKQNYL